MNYYDSQKFSLAYFLQYQGVTHEESDMACFQIPQLVGSDTSDAYAFAFMHYKIGIGWDQCRIMLDAFPTLTYSDLDVGWEIMGGVAKSKFDEETLIYLRKRLQVGTKEVLGMLKVSQLVEY